MFNSLTSLLFRLLVKRIWQPIETAPRDGTVIDLWHKSGARVSEVWWTDDSCWTNLLGDDQFTHWSPIITPFGILTTTGDTDEL